MKTLTTTRPGRIILHLIVLCKVVAAGKKPNYKFTAKGIIREIKGI